MEITVFVPMVDSAIAADIAAGSGIVGTPISGAVGQNDRETLIIDEVAPTDLTQLTTFADRVQAAAEQHINGPVKRSLVTRSGFAQVGRWDHAQRVLSLQPGCSSIVAAWLGTDTVDPRELQVSRS